MEMNANEIREASAKLRAEGDALVAKGGPRSVRNGSSAIVAANIADALADAIGSGIFVHTARSLMDAIEGPALTSVPEAPTSCWPLTRRLARRLRPSSLQQSQHGTKHTDNNHDPARGHRRDKMSTFNISERNDIGTYFAVSFQATGPSWDAPKTIALDCFCRKATSLIQRSPTRTRIAANTG